MTVLNKSLSTRKGRAGASVAIGGKARSSRPPLIRMIKLHQLISAEKFPNCQKAAAELEVSPKTVQRDIEFMRSQMGLPIEYHQTEFGFYYTKPVTHFPTLEISEGEVVALFIAQRALAQYRRTAFEKPLASVCQKLTASLHGKISVTWNELDAAISFRAAGASMPDLAVFEAISEAVLQSVEITFQYHKLGSPQIELRRAQPYHLGCVENQWYCFAHDLDRGQIRTFALLRMREVKVSGKKFRRPEDFSLRKYLGESFGVFHHAEPGERQAVRIRFDAWAARLVSERLWHESQSLRTLADGTIELRLELSGMEEIERWVLSWGEHAEVITPKRLRERVTEIAQRIASRHPR